MKVRWKEHEMIFVTTVVLWQIVKILLRVYTLPVAELEANFAVQFEKNGVPFNFWINVLLPQVSSLLLMYMVYLSVNLLVLPQIKRISEDDMERLLSKRVAIAILSALTVSYLLAIGINVISFYGRPHLFNYGEYQFLSIVGYNDRPLDNLFFGLGRALGVVALVVTLASLRDIIIWYIERPDTGREFRVFVTNNTTPFIFLYFLLLVIIDPVHADFIRYIVFVTPLLVFYLYLTFFLFPFKEEKSFLDKSVLFRLLLASLGCAAPSLMLFFERSRIIIPILFWAFELFIATPVIWVFYQQRKDKIIQLKNMESALAKSDANFQFLKSQINPHFLFNALNTLYGTALRGDIEKTADGIQKLGDMMRFMLHENARDFIPMNKELEYLKNFIALQKLRVHASPDITIEDEIEEQSCKNQIAPMLLIPFVENAFKHGISLSEKSWIKIGLTCRDNIVNFEVRNSIHTNANDIEKSKSGIGLANVKGRLKLQYPGKHLLDIRETGDEYTVKLEIKC